MGATIPRFEGTIKEKIKFYLIIAIIYCAIALIINLSPSSPKDTITTKQITTYKTSK